MKKINCLCCFIYELTTQYFFFIVLILLIFLCQGCGIFVSDAKYNADAAMWQAKGLASAAWAAQANQPLATFTTVNKEVITVNNPIRPVPMEVTGEPNGFVEGLRVILTSTPANILAGGWVLNRLFDKVEGDTISHGDNSPITTKKNSENPVEVTTRHVEGDGSITEHKDSDNTDNTTTDNRTNYDNTTTDGRSNYDNITSTDNRTNYDNTTTDGRSNYDNTTVPTETK